nr:RNA-directed DNA polymerase, eukaryota [Tanacetum cinerariifolium]
MLLLLVQGKLSNLTVEERFAFNVSLRIFTRTIVIQRRVEDLQLGVESYQKRLNLTKPDTYRSDLKRRDKDRAAAMIQSIDKMLKTRRIMRSLERFVGGRLDVEGVSDTIFDENLASPVNRVCQSAVNESDPSLSHPPGFSSEASRPVDDPIGEGIDTGFVKESSPSVHSKVMNNSEEVHVKEVSKGNSEFRQSHNNKGGLILEVLDDMVWVGQSMGYDMDGLGHKTKKEWVNELNLQHKVNFLTLQETNMERITHMDVKLIWANSNYQFVSRDSVGNSGRILCIWEAIVFKKAYVTVSDNFIAIYGTWISNNSKVLIVVVYASQSLALKRALWEYISSLISHWDGESIVIGDFNDVRSIEERLGSVFNHSSARSFNCFIEASSLVDVKLEGYSFTWSHPSASKISKLDQFLVLKGAAKSIKENLTDIDKNLDRRNVSDELLLKRMDFTRQLLEIKQMEAKDWVQKSKIKWAIKGTKTRNTFMGRFKLNFLFPNRLSNDQVVDLDRCISHDEIRGAVWNCVVKKSPGPDGFTFEFFRRYWSFIGPDFCLAIDCFFESDGPFILNELIAWCKRKKKQAMIFKVDFAKVYGSVRWDYLLDVLHAFGFGPNWCKWIRGMFSSSMALVLVNGNPSLEFPFFCGLKQGDPLAPYLFILIMESLHISFSRATSAGVFNGIRINDSTVISHLFYADDAIFMGEWSDYNMANIVKILRCFFLASGLKINIQKSQILGVGIHRNHVSRAALLIGCTVIKTPFQYLGVMVGDCMARKFAWSDIVYKSHHRLSKWKVKTLSIGGRLTLLNSVLGATPLYNMSIYKVLIGSLSVDVSFRRPACDGAEHQQWSELCDILEHVILSSSKDRWTCDLNGDGKFRVKEVRSLLDNIFLPSTNVPTRWVKFIPININIFAWRAA